MNVSDDFGNGMKYGIRYALSRSIGQGVGASASEGGRSTAPAGEDAEHPPPPSRNPWIPEFPMQVDDCGEEFGTERWMARCPNIPGCIVSGATREEAIAELHKSIGVKIAFDYGLPAPPQQEQP